MLKPCRECGRQVARDAKQCPHCGRANPSRRLGALTKVAVGFCGLVLVGVLAASLTPHADRSRRGSASDTALLAPDLLGPVQPRDTAARTAAIFLATRTLTTNDGEYCGPGPDERMKRVRELVRTVPYWNDDVLALIACQMIRVGMDEAQVRESLGYPDHVNRGVYGGGTRVHEQWVYGEHGRMYVYLENGAVTSWQTSSGY